ncbi:MAG: glycosyl transferase family 39 [Methylotenera sp.]|nr:MAG: glycosyl transferase family 39 [Methylotenera sp.]
MHLFQKAPIFNIKNLLILAILLRVIWACLVPVVPVSDSFLYDVFAQSIATGNGYAFPNGDITVYWPVGTSAIYAIIYKIFGISFLPIVVFNIVIGTLIVWLTYAIAQRYLNNNVALIAAFLVALWPILIQFTTILASEIIFIFLILSAIYVWGCKQLSPILRAIIWGALICVATYVRPTAQFIFLFLPILDWLANKDRRAAIQSFCIAAITAALLFSPWVYRNHQVFGEFVLVSANGGVNLWMGNNPNSNGGYNDLTDLPFKNEVTRDNYFKKEAIDFIVHNPLSYAKLALKRALITYKAETIGIVWNGYLEKHFTKPILIGMKLISSIFWWLVLVFAGIGVYKLLKERRLAPFNALFAVAAFFFVFPILTVAQDRYHLPINPFLAIFAAYTLQSMLSNYNLIRAK